MSAAAWLNCQRRLLRNRYRQSSCRRRSGVDRPAAAARKLPPSALSMRSPSPPTRSKCCSPTVSSSVRGEIVSWHRDAGNYRSAAGSCRARGAAPDRRAACLMEEAGRTGPDRARATVPVRRRLKMDTTSSLYRLILPHQRAQLPAVITPDERWDLHRKPVAFQRPPVAAAPAPAPDRASAS